MDSPSHTASVNTEASSEERTRVSVPTRCGSESRDPVDLVTDSASPDPLAEAGCNLKRFNICVPIFGISPEEKRQMIAVGGNLMSFDLVRYLWKEMSVK